MCFSGIIMLEKLIAGIAAAGILLTSIPASAKPKEYLGEYKLSLNLGAEAAEEYSLTPEQEKKPRCSEIPPYLIGKVECELGSQPTYAPSPSPAPIPTSNTNPSYSSSYSAPSYTAPPERTEKSHSGDWGMIGGGIAMVVLGGFIAQGIQATHCPANSNDCSSNDDVGGYKIIGGAMVVGGLAMTIYGIVELNSD